METDDEPLLPDFLLMLKYVLDKCALRVKSAKHRVDLGGVQLPFRPEVYAEVLAFLRACLVLSSGALPHLEELRNPQTYGPRVTGFLAGCAAANVVPQSLEFGEQLMRATQGPAQAQYLLQLTGCSPVLSFQWFESKLAWIRGLLGNTR